MQVMTSATLDGCCWHVNPEPLTAGKLLYQSIENRRAAFPEVVDAIVEALPCRRELRSRDGRIRSPDPTKYRKPTEVQLSASLSLNFVYAGFRINPARKSLLAHCFDDPCHAYANLMDL